MVIKLNCCPPTLELDSKGMKPENLKVIHLRTNLMHLYHIVSTRSLFNDKLVKKLAFSVIEEVLKDVYEG